jgi:hypothetical protein
VRSRLHRPPNPDPDPDATGPGPGPTPNQVMLAALDYPQLKSALLEGAEDEAPLLLQALRC